MIAASLQMQSIVALLACVLCAVAAVNADGVDPNVQFIEARMGQFKVDHEDAYLCTAVPLPDEPLKLVGIEPLAKQEIAHHMLLFGEAQPPAACRSASAAACAKAWLQATN